MSQGRLPAVLAASKLIPFAIGRYVDAFSKEKSPLPRPSKLPGSCRLKRTDPHTEKPEHGPLRINYLLPIWRAYAGGTPILTRTVFQKPLGTADYMSQIVQKAL
jgi:hypothetical protein